MIGLGMIVGLIWANLYIYIMLLLPIVNPNPAGSKNVLDALIAYFTNPAKLAFIWTWIMASDIPGSSPMLKYMLIPLILIPILYGLHELARKKWPQSHRIFWANWTYIVAAEIFMFYVTTANGIAQYENWYWNEVLKVPGTADFLTHANLAGALCILFLMIAWADIIGLHQARLAMLFDSFISYLIANLGAVWFEWTESLNPAKYMNILGNMQSDLAAVFVGLLVAYFIYTSIVPRTISGYD
jgi:hypothetical protein